MGQPEWGVTAEERRLGEARTVITHCFESIEVDLDQEVTPAGGVFFGVTDVRGVIDERRWGALKDCSRDRFVVASG
jgi:hypothetical protein